MHAPENQEPIILKADNIPLLLVEDDSSLARSLSDFLSDFGYDIDFAFNGRSAIELASTNGYAVIIMDVSMPIMDGLTACQALRRDHGVNTPIIFLTASTPEYQCTHRSLSPANRAPLTR
ncbi:response regulator [Halioglobus maricola]|uniref:Response regulator n=1 Tax=Halioglobus maricola TaxID=2601894 RepID=A0A5P9NL66_9GAMM|nr:response regulator [Halioglobus maricola]